MALIHVVIPCYNVEDYLKQTVDSVLSQPYKGIDIVLVDDGSPGKTPWLCDELAGTDPRIHVIHKTNGGVSDARNAGIGYALNHLVHSEREFIAFLDGDDIWCPGVIDDQLVEHLLTDWKEDVISFAGIASNNALTQFSVKSSTVDIGNTDARPMMWQAQITHFSTKLYAADTIRKWNLRFHSGQAYSEDKIFILQFFTLAEKARFINKTLHVYRKNRTGAISGIRKMSAVDYYLPIIDGWLKCDAFLNALTDRTGYTSDAGQTLAAIYLVEMVAEHMKKWGSFREIMEIFQNHPHYPVAESGELIRSNTREYPVNRLLFEHPMQFRMKYRLLGAVEWLLWKLLRIPFVSALWERKRYPYTEIPK